MTIHVNDRGSVANTKVVIIRHDDGTRDALRRVNRIFVNDEGTLREVYQAITSTQTQVPGGPGGTPTPINTQQPVNPSQIQRATQTSISTTRDQPGAGTSINTQTSTTYATSVQQPNPAIQVPTSVQTTTPVNTQVPRNPFPFQTTTDFLTHVQCQVQTQIQQPEPYPSPIQTTRNTTRNTFEQTDVQSFYQTITFDTYRLPRQQPTTYQTNVPQPQPYQQPAQTQVQGGPQPYQVNVPQPQPYQTSTSQLTNAQTQSPTFSAFQLQGPLTFPVQAPINGAPVQGLAQFQIPQPPFPFQTTTTVIIDEGGPANPLPLTEFITIPIQQPNPPQVLPVGPIEYTAPAQGIVGTGDAAQVILRYQTLRNTWFPTQKQTTAQRQIQIPQNRQTIISGPQPYQTTRQRQVQVPQPAVRQTTIQYETIFTEQKSTSAPVQTQQPRQTQVQTSVQVPRQLQRQTTVQQSFIRSYLQPRQRQTGTHSPNPPLQVQVQQPRNTQRQTSQPRNPFPFQRQTSAPVSIQSQQPGQPVQIPVQTTTTTQTNVQQPNTPLQVQVQQPSPGGGAPVQTMEYLRYTLIGGNYHLTAVQSAGDYNHVYYDDGSNSWTEAQ